MHSWDYVQWRQALYDARTAAPSASSAVRVASQVAGFAHLD